MKIVLCTMAINSWYYDIVRYAIKNMIEYSNSHNYTFVIDKGGEGKGGEETVYDKTRQEPWFKIKLIRKILDTHPDCDYVVWMDADCQILLPEKKLEYFIEKFSTVETDIITTIDPGVLNTGIMFIKNTEFSKDLMDKIWNFNKDIADYFKDFHEQTAFADIYTNSEYTQKKVCILPYAIKDELVTYWGNYYPNKNFLLHSARCSNDRLAFMYMMDLYNIFKLDEESDEQYKRRMEWLSDENICRKDIDGWMSGGSKSREYSQRCLNFIERGKMNDFRERKSLIHWFPFCSGGLCDRILGIAGNLCIANTLNRKLVLKWDNVPLTPTISINPEFDYYTENKHYDHVNLNNFESMDYFKTKDIKKEWGTKNIMIWSNINLYYYLSINPHFKEVDYIKKFSDAIKYTLNTIFRIDENVFKNLKIYDIGIHIRTSDKQLYIKEKEELYRPYITNVFDKIKKVNQCDGKSVFISSDCLLTFDIAKTYFKNFHYNEGEVVHTAHENKNTSSGVYKVCLDLLTLANVKDTLYIGWNSNFSRIAALYNDTRKTICYEYNNDVREMSNEVLFSYHSTGKYD